MTRKAARKPSGPSRRTFLLGLTAAAAVPSLALPAPDPRALPPDELRAWLIDRILKLPPDRQERMLAELERLAARHAGAIQRVEV